MSPSRPLLMVTCVTALQLAAALESTSLWQQALQHHGWSFTDTGDSINQCQPLPTAAIRVNLQPTGFHGHIQYTLDHSQLVLTDDCQLTVLQPLPAGIYADPYELGSLVSTSGGSKGFALQMSSFRLFGTIDVEKIESECNATVLAVSAQLHTFRDETWSCPSMNHSILSVPLHARYPAPKMQPLPGSLTPFLGAHHQYNLADPTVSVKCASSPLLKSGCVSSAVSEANQAMQLRWVVPAGGLWHALLVQLVTFVSAVYGLFILVKAVLVQHQNYSA